MKSKQTKIFSFSEDFHTGTLKEAPEEKPVISISDDNIPVVVASSAYVAMVLALEMSESISIYDMISILGSVNSRIGVDKCLGMTDTNDGYHEIESLANNFYEKYSRDEMLSILKTSEDNDKTSVYSAMQSEISERGYNAVCVSSSGDIITLNPGFHRLATFLSNDYSVLQNDLRALNRANLKIYAMRLELVLKDFCRMNDDNADAFFVFLRRISGWFLYKTETVGKIDVSKYTVKSNPGDLSASMSSTDTYVSQKASLLALEQWNSAAVISCSEEPVLPDIFPRDVDESEEETGMQSDMSVAFRVSLDEDSCAHPSINPVFTPDLCHWNWKNDMEDLDREFSDLSKSDMTQLEQVEWKSAKKREVAQSISGKDAWSSFTSKEPGGMLPTSVSDTLGIRRYVLFHSTSDSKEGDLKDYPDRIHVVKATLRDVATKKKFVVLLFDPVNLYCWAIPESLFLASALARGATSRELVNVPQEKFQKPIIVVMTMLAVSYRFSKFSEKETDAVSILHAYSTNSDYFSDLIKEVYDDANEPFVDYIRSLVSLYLRDTSWIFVDAKHTKKGRKRLDAMRNTTERVSHATSIASTSQSFFSFGDGDEEPPDRDSSDFTINV